MTVALALLAFGVVFIGVAAASEKFTPLVAIGGLLIVIGVAKLFFTA